MASKEKQDKRNLYLLILILAFLFVSVVLSVFLVSQPQIVNTEASGCVTGAYKCTGKSLYQCRNGTFVLVRTCANTLTCSVSAKGCIDVCLDGEQKCTMDVDETGGSLLISGVKRCYNDKWQQYFYCTSGGLTNCSCNRATPQKCFCVD